MNNQNDDYEFQVFIHPSQVHNLWQNINEKLKKSVGSKVYDSWLKPLDIVTYDGKKLILSAPNRFFKDRVLSQYGREIELICKKNLPGFNELDVIIQEHSDVAVQDSITPKPTSVSIKDDDHTEDFTHQLDRRFTFDNFIVGKPNELAYAAAMRVCESASPGFNPLFLYGGVGLGKTHLMHAIGWRISELHKDKKIIYMSAEKFMYEFIKSIRYKDTVSFKEKFRSANILMIDDVQFIGGKDSTQEEFFHTFNELIDNNHQVIISADKSPSDLENVQERLKSRLGWGLVADIHPTTFELRLGILESKVDMLKTQVPQEVLQFLAEKIISNIRELEGALNRVVAHSSLVGRKITLETTQNVLRDLLKSNERRMVTIDDIQSKVADFYHYTIAELVSSRRQQRLMYSRHIAIYLCKILTSKSYVDIGKKFGNRDHTTIMHSVKKIESELYERADLREDIDLIKRKLHV